MSPPAPLRVEGQRGRLIRMDAAELLNFLEHKMSMTHIYQPLIIRSLLDAGGSATVRQLAVELAKSNEMDLRYYEKIVKRWPRGTLRKHGVIEVEADRFVLQVKKLSFQERSRLRAACDQKIGEFLTERGLDTWYYSRDLVPTSLAYEVFRRCRGVCQACGAGADEERLEIDHIKPRKPSSGKTGGKTTLDNLQVLCRRCNAGKSNKDDTDFRPGAKQALRLQEVAERMEADELTAADRKSIKKALATIGDKLASG